MKILFLQKRLLFPHNTGWKIRTLNILRHLAKWHDVTYVCNLLPEERPFCAPMEALGVRLKSVDWVEYPRRSLQFSIFATQNLFSGNPLNVDKDFDTRLRQLVESEVKTGSYDLLICDFVQMARNCLGLDLPKLLFQHNVEAEIFERLSRRSKGIFGSYLGLQAKRMIKFEGAAGKDFDRVVAVSRRDQEQFENRYNWQHVGLIETAVDTKYFSPPNPPLARSGVVFVGSMDWAPNIDGMMHFIDRIWPTVRAEINDAKLVVVGRNPPASLLNRGVNGITITGTVEDTRPFLASAAVAIVPLYSGGGTRLKIFESMAMKCPVVSTTLGAEGLKVQAGQQIYIADDDEEFGDKILKLLRDTERCEMLSAAAFELVTKTYASEPVARQFEQHCFDAVATWKAKKSL